VVEFGGKCFRDHRPDLMAFREKEMPLAKFITWGTALHPGTRPARQNDLTSRGAPAPHAG
jgi:hypothetical protein